MSSLITKAIVFSLLLLIGCTTTSEEELMTKEEEYTKSLKKNLTIIDEVVMALKRQSLVLETDDISSGIYAPSEIYAKSVRSNSLGLTRLIGAIASGNVSGYHESSTNDVLDTPKQKTVLELMNERARNYDLDDGLNSKDQTILPSASYFGCTLQSTVDPCLELIGSEDIGETVSYIDSICGSPYEKKEDVEIASRMELADLDYRIVIKNTPKKKYCDQLYSDSLQGQTKDLSLLSALKEEEARQIELAAYSYNDSELNKLIFLLPSKYRGRKDTQIYIPDSMSRYLHHSFNKISNEINLSFSSLEPIIVELTFDREELNIRYENEIKELWLNALAHPNGKLYISPPMAFSAFILCYKVSISDYLDSRYNFNKYVARDNYASATREDLNAFDSIFASQSKRYNQCVDSQVSFLIAHELGHLYGYGHSDSLRDTSETFADCFGFIQLQRIKHFDFGLMLDVALKDKPSDNIARKKLNKLRRNQISYLKLHFDSTELPKTGEEIIDFCTN